VLLKRKGFTWNFHEIHSSDTSKYLQLHFRIGQSRNRLFFAPFRKVSTITVITFWLSSLIELLVAIIVIYDCTSIGEVLPGFGDLIQRSKLTSTVEFFGVSHFKWSKFVIRLLLWTVLVLSVAPTSAWLLISTLTGILSYSICLCVGEFVFNLRGATRV
jgi:hypothetical protein